MEFGYNMRTLTGQFLKGISEALKLELGVGTPVFVTDFRKYGALATSSWTQHNWEGYTPRGSTLRIKWATLHFGDEETNTLSPPFTTPKFGTANW
jgi:hypothetical protein